MALLKTHYTVWPSREELQEIERKHVLPAIFQEVYSKITEGNERWNDLDAPDTMLYPWDEKSTYIQKPPFFAGMVCVCVCVCMCVRVYVCACIACMCVCVVLDGRTSTCFSSVICYHTAAFTGKPDKHLQTSIIIIT